MATKSYALPVPTVVDTFGAWTLVSDLDPAVRTFIFDGADAADRIEIWASNDNGTNMAKLSRPGRELYGPGDAITLPDASMYYAVKRVAGTAAANATVAAQELPDEGELETIETTIAHGDLVAAATSQAINLGSALPANAQIIAVSIALATAFTGGGAASVVVDIGTAGDVDALIDGANLIAAPVDGQASTRPLGIAPNKFFVAAGAQLIATVIADVNVADLTAGSCTVRITYKAQG